MNSNRAHNKANRASQAKRGQVHWDAAVNQWGGRQDGQDRTRVASPGYRRIPAPSSIAPARRCRAEHLTTIILMGDLPPELEEHLFGLSDQEFAALMRGEAVRTPARGVTVRVASDKAGECTVVLYFTPDAWKRFRHLDA